MSVGAFVETLEGKSGRVENADLPFRTSESDVVESFGVVQGDDGGSPVSFVFLLLVAASDAEVFLSPWFPVFGSVGNFSSFSVSFSGF